MLSAFHPQLQSYAFWVHPSLCLRQTLISIVLLNTCTDTWHPTWLCADVREHVLHILLGPTCFDAWQPCLSRSNEGLAPMCKDP